MLSIPAQCTRCGLMFQPLGGIEITNSSNITFSGNTTNCPRCGGVARFIDGTFDVVGDAIQMGSGPAWSWQVVEALRLGLKQVQETQPEDPVAAVEAISPKVGGALRGATQGWTRDQVLMLIAALLALLTWADVTPSDVGKRVVDVEQQLLDAIENAKSDGPPPSSP